MQGTHMTNAKLRKIRHGVLAPYDSLRQTVHICFYRYACSTNQPCLGRYRVRLALFRTATSREEVGADGAAVPRRLKRDTAAAGDRSAWR